ncbi:MAG: hypothetical protein Tsb0014_21150 [Pleurocapsa sp.]
MSYHSPQSSKNAPASNSQIIIVIGIFVSAIALIFWLLNLLIHGLIGIIPPEVERKLGAVIVPVYEKQAQVSPQQDTLNQLLDRLEKNLPEKQQKQHNYQVLYIPEPTINALAVPGDRVIIYRGLLEKMGSENELMMVLGHELGHFAHRDHLRGLGNALVLRMTISLFLGDSSFFQNAIATAVKAIGNARFSQSQEKQADEFGLILLNKTYGHVAGATDFFTQLSKEKKRDVSFLSTHPAPQQRVKEMQKIIAKNNYKLEDKLPLPITLQNLS